MADLEAGHWILISDGSLDKLKTFFRGCREQGVETAGMVVAPPACRKLISAAALDWPSGWSVYNSGPLWSDRDQWFGLLWDDQCPESPHWDRRLVEQTLPWRVVTSLEGMSGDWREAAICWGVPALSIGGLRLTELYSALALWAHGAKEAKILMVEQGVQLPRRGHRSAARIENYADQGMIDALRALMAQHGVRVIEPDWTGISLMISTPSMSSRPEALYMISLMGMLKDLDSNGVPYTIGLERYNADIGLARSHIISEFLRTDRSHLLMIDDDMTWDVTALHRLVYAKKDLVAVAGPKKRYPLVFAASLTDPDGKPVNMQIDMETGTAEVTSVGTAFMLISRKCAEAMRDAYPELEYDGGDGKTQWGLFCQMVTDRQYKPEDFSFCERWRRIGGKVYICPDVPLGHIGSHEFRGDLLSNAANRATQ